MKVLVTGGAGFIGSHVVDKLLSKHHNITAIDDLSTGRRQNLPTEVKLVEKSVHRVTGDDVKGYDWVIHCAAQVSTFLSVDYPLDDFKQNALSTFRLFESLRKYNDNVRVIFTSSRSVLGDIPKDKVANEGFRYNPGTFYSAHKTYGELLCKIYGELYGMKCTVLRPSNVYGPRQPYWMAGWYDFISFWIKLALEGKPLPIYGSGRQIRDYVYVDDVATAFLLALENSAAIGETFLLASGRGVNLLELAETINKLTGNKSELQFFPARKGDILRFLGNSGKAKELLGWSCKLSLETGLKRELDWMRTEIPQHRH